MQVSEVWLTPEQAASVSGRSMIAIRALLQTTTEDDGARHLLQIFDDGAGGTAYRLHRSLVTSEGLRHIGADDVIEVLSRRVEELEAELEVLRLRSSSMRSEVSRPVVQAESPVIEPVQTSAQLPTQGGDNSTWIILGSIILITIVIVVYILFKQGFLSN